MLNISIKFVSLDSNKDRIIVCKNASPSLKECLSTNMPYIHTEIDTLGDALLCITLHTLKHI